MFGDKGTLILNTFLGKHIERTRLLDNHYDERTKPNETDYFKFDSSILLQVISTDCESGIRVTDGHSYIFLKLGREKEALKELANKINSNCPNKYVKGTLYRFDDFRFDLSWDYNQRALRISLEPENIKLFFIGQLLPKYLRVRDLASSLSTTNKHYFKTRFMSRTLTNNQEEKNLDQDDIFCTTSGYQKKTSKAVELTLDKDTVNFLDNLLGTGPEKPKHIKKEIDRRNERKIEEREQIKNQLIDDCVTDHWLVFPESVGYKIKGGVISSSNFYSKCKLILK